MAKRRSKRLRKKLHIDEFQEMGFPYATTLKSELSEEASCELLDAFLTEVIESRDLALGGGLTSGYIARAGRGSVSNDDRIAVEAWLCSRSEFESVEVGQLQDAWYDY